MLAYESLLDYAKERGLPAGKVRGILREYLQVLILGILCRSRWSGHFYFLGGTCLRLIHDFGRFSEDLDFKGRDLSRPVFEEAARHIQQELAREGISCQVDFKYRGKLSTASYDFGDEILRRYRIADRRGRLLVKLEVHQPGWKLPAEEKVIRGFGEMFPITAMTQGYIFSEKILTLRTHRLGRHIYDLIMMLSRKFPVDEKVLKAQGAKPPALELLKEVIATFTPAELKKLAASLRPFLFREEEADYVRRAPFYLDQLLGRPIPKKPFGTATGRG